MPTRRWVLSPWTQISWQAGRIEIACLASDVLFRTDDPEVILVLNAFAKASTIQEAQRRLPSLAVEDVSRCVEILIEAGVLVDGSLGDPSGEPPWDPISLAFHRASRALGQQAAPVAPDPATAGAARLVIALAPPVRREARSLPELLQSRRSTRNWPERSIPFQDFSDFLDLSIRDIAQPSQAPHERRRSYPSGGALYSLEFYPVLAASAVDGLSAGTYRYMPGAHALEELARGRASNAPFLEAAASSAGGPAPPIVIVITSRIASPMKVYGALAYSLVLKEVGAVFQVFYLVAAHLGLAACALGGGAPEALLSRVAGVSGLDEPIVGEFMLGPR
jgi:SagB-type dehydrogenase family enzyme